MINLKKYAFDRYCRSRRSFLCFPIAAVRAPSQPLRPIFSFFRWKADPRKPSVPFFARGMFTYLSYPLSLSLAYYFIACNDFFFSRCTLHFSLNVLWKSYDDVLCLFRNLLSHSLFSIFLFIFFSMLILFFVFSVTRFKIFVVFIGSFLNAQNMLCACMLDDVNILVPFFPLYSYYPFISVSFISPFYRPSLLPSSRKITIPRGNSCRSRQHLINW